MKKKSWIVVVGFILGIMIANIWGKEFVTTYGILNVFFLNQYANTRINYEQLLCQLLWVRGKEAFFLFVLTKIFPTKAVQLVLECLLAMTFGILFVLSILNLGLFGIIIMIGGLFPQWLLYLCALKLFFGVQLRRECYCKKKICDLMVESMAILLCFLLGILSEAYISPFLWQLMIKDTVW